MKLTLELPDATYALSVVIVWDKANEPGKMHLAMSGLEASGSELYNGQRLTLPEEDDAP